MSLKETSRRVLEACVEEITGRTDIPPRPGQLALLDDIATAFEGAQDDEDQQVAGEAPTGTGKSLAYLIPAAVAAAEWGARTVISTEMISLQSQITDKDAPVVARACEKVTGYAPKVAVLKGFGNYVCTAAAVEAARERSPGTGNDLAALARASGPGAAAWGLTQALSDGTGDKASYEDDLLPGEWDSVSTSAADCVGEAKCPFSEACLPRKARREAAAADIVIVNHHLLGVQAANSVPVVLSSRTLGVFDHIVADEAHGLPSIVRNHGAMEISGPAIRKVATTVANLLDSGHDATASSADANESKLGFADLVRDRSREEKGDTAARRRDLRRQELRRLGQAGQLVAAEVEKEIGRWISRIDRREKTLRLGEGDDPLESAAATIGMWAKACGSALTRAVAYASQDLGEDEFAKTDRRAQIAANRVSKLKKAAAAVSLHEPGTARWIEVETPRQGAPYPCVKYAPVDVSGAIAHELWSVRDFEAEEAQAEEAEGDGPPPRRKLAVIALSATLPESYPREAGMAASLSAYASPFDDAYARSVLYAPRARDDADVSALMSDNSWGGKPRLDTRKHTGWAASHIEELVAANGGSALILSATAAAGKEYAARLRRLDSHWDVLSQWDGPPASRQVARWKADPAAVLIGTKSYMTGIDASGETCTLVIVDRPARAAGNPVDDARVELLTAGGMNKWEADRRVYVEDAALLLAQSAGRLIRSISDSGMVAVLDPRLLKSSKFRYSEPVRQTYLGALSHFTVKVAGGDEALAWLQGRTAEPRSA
ncbi:MAG: ATP-dependent DNA helicase [Nocardioides sp.]